MSSDRDGTPACAWSIRERLSIDASAKAVWEYVATPELISQWWCPPPTVRIAFERRAGGRYEEYYRGPERSYELFGTVAVYSPHHRIAIRRSTENEFGRRDLIEITLVEGGDLTTVSVDHSFDGLPKRRQEEAYEFFASNWSDSLRRLRDLVTQGTA